jgi:dGTPase
MCKRRHNEKTNTNDYRNPFQHDRDRIIHCLAFKRLKEKTQVFAPEKSDHLRNRLSHTLEVSAISRTIARALRLNEDLAEAIALGHDLGHSPFGHSGESVINDILTGKIKIQDSDKEAFNRVGGFKHNYQSVRIIDSIEKKYLDYKGLNLTDKVREGILKHTSIKGKIYNIFCYEGLNIDKASSFPEANVVAITDEIAQQCHDLEDGIRLGLAKITDLQDTLLVENTTIKTILEKGDSYNVMVELIRSLFKIFIDDIVFASMGKDTSTLEFSKEVAKIFMSLKDFVYSRIIFSRDVARSDYLAKKVIKGLFNSFYNNPLLLPDYVLYRVSDESKIPFFRTLSFQDRKKYKIYLKSCDKFIRILADYIGGMTDSYAIKELQQITL